MIDKIVERLNEVLLNDSDGLYPIVEYAQVSSPRDQYIVGFLALLNGLIGAGIDNDYIAVTIKDQKITKVERLDKDYFKENKVKYAS